jgi:hypothetical protein
MHARLRFRIRTHPVQLNKRGRAGYGGKRGGHSIACLPLQRCYSFHVRPRKCVSLRKLLFIKLFYLGANGSVRHDVHDSLARATHRRNASPYSLPVQKRTGRSFERGGRARDVASCYFVTCVSLLCGCWTQGCSAKLHLRRSLPQASNYIVPRGRPISAFVPECPTRGDVV